MTTEYAAVGYMVFFGGMIQTIAGLTEFARNNMFAGTALASYGAFWIGYGQLQYLSVSTCFNKT